MHFVAGAVDEMGSKSKAAQAAEDIKVEDAGLQQLAQRIQAEALGLQEESGIASHLPVNDHELEKLNVRCPVVAYSLQEICPPLHLKVSWVVSLALLGVLNLFISNISAAPHKHVFISHIYIFYITVHVALCRNGQEMGAMGIHSHDRLLGGTKKDRARACEAALKHAKDLEEEPPEPAAATGTAPAVGLTAAQANKRVKKYAGATSKEASHSARPHVNLPCPLLSVVRVVLLQADIISAMDAVHEVRGACVTVSQQSGERIILADLSLSNVCAGEPDAKSAVVRVMSQLESLAAWKGMDVTDMACKLIAMTAVQRTQLRQEYAAADHGLMSQPGWSTLYTGRL